jgi:hypothetical protein
MKDSARYAKIVEWSEEDQCSAVRLPPAVASRSSAIPARREADPNLISSGTSLAEGRISYGSPSNSASVGRVRGPFSSQTA